MSAAPLRVLGSTSARVTAFSFAFDLTRYRRRLALTRAETTALTALGAEGLRRSRARGAARDDASWARLANLVSSHRRCPGHVAPQRLPVAPTCRKRCRGTGAGPLPEGRTVVVGMDSGGLA